MDLYKNPYRQAKDYDRQMPDTYEKPCFPAHLFAKRRPPYYFGRIKNQTPIIMKKTFLHALLGLIFVSSFALVSCSKDKEDGKEINADKVIGKWTVTKYETVTVVEGNKNSSTDTPDVQTTLEFKSDGKVVGESDGTYNGTWKLEGNQLTIVGLDMTYGDTETFTVQEATSSSLKLNSKYSVNANNYVEWTLFLTK
jgi:uncharacterized protein (TIGR03066 family)